MNLEIQWLNQVEYTTAWEQQKAIVAAKTADPHTPDYLLLLEHPPTYTLGRRGKLEHLLLSEAELAERGFALHWVDRGGDITYHGPGQLVGYPLLDLQQWYAAHGNGRPDLIHYLRNLEETLIRTLAHFGIPSWRYDGYTGVWTDSPRGPEKIAAIGVKINVNGISSHGFALNVNPNLAHFDHIIPCGISDHGVTSMSRVLQRPLYTTDILPHLLTNFSQIFHYHINPLPTPV
jgi:lipoyl(octanoyl) transferase